MKIEGVDSVNRISKTSRLKEKESSIVVTRDKVVGVGSRYKVVKGTNLLQTSTQGCDYTTR